jgi:hypothetical protein
VGDYLQFRIGWALSVLYLITTVRLFTQLKFQIGQELQVTQIFPQKMVNIMHQLLVVQFQEVQNLKN